MDIQLPLMDGYISAKKIREFMDKVVIIAQTAYGLSGDMENILASGFDDYLIKPIYSGQLIEKISSFLP
jgi:CheY-like chemotaxis protein